MCEFFSCKKPKSGVGNPNIYELFLGFWTHLGCLVSETQHVRIIFGILDPPGMYGVKKPNIYELFFGIRTHLGCLVSETQHLRIIFGIWCWKPIFRENVSKTLIFTRFGSRRGTRKRIQWIQTIQRIQRKWSTAGSSHPRLLAPEARMTVVKQTPSKYLDSKVLSC